MTSPTPPAGWPVPVRPPFPPEPARPYGSAFFWLTGLSVVTGAVGGYLFWLVIIALRELADDFSDTAGQNGENISDSAVAPALVAGFVLFGVLLGFGAGCLAVLRASDGYARMPTFVQALLAWMLALMPTGMLGLAYLTLGG